MIQNWNKCGDIPIWGIDPLAAWYWKEKTWWNLYCKIRLSALGRHNSVVGAKESHLPYLKNIHIQKRDSDSIFIISHTFWISTFWLMFLIKCRRNFPLRIKKLFFIPFNFQYIWFTKNTKWIKRKVSHVTFPFQLSQIAANLQKH